VEEVDGRSADGSTGRIGLGARRVIPGTFYALVENKKGTLYDTNDLGDHWKMVSTTTTWRHAAFISAS